MFFERILQAAEHPCFDHQHLHAVLQAISAGETLLTLPQWSTQTGTLEKRTVKIDLSEVDIILFEGLYAISQHEPYNFAQYCTIRLYLCATETDMLSWNWQREQQKTYHRRDRARFDKAVAWDMHNFRTSIEASRSGAHIVVQHTANHTYTQICR
jgi:uridine kinase